MFIFTHRAERSSKFVERKSRYVYLAIRDMVDLNDTFSSTVVPGDGIAVRTTTNPFLSRTTQSSTRDLFPETSKAGMQTRSYHTQSSAISARRTSTILNALRGKTVGLLVRGTFLIRSSSTVKHSLQRTGIKTSTTFERTRETSPCSSRRSRKMMRLKCTSRPCPPCCGWTFRHPGPWSVWFPERTI